jgi:ubiquinone/menaquinone biosynthesis C-methylase UbiE
MLATPRSSARAGGLQRSNARGTPTISRTGAIGRRRPAAAAAATTTAAASIAVAALAPPDAAAGAAAATAVASLDRRAVLLSAAAAAAASASSPLLPTPAAAVGNVDYDPFAQGYDGLDGAAPADALGLPDLRRALLSRARGHVLELAVGTGLNLPLYDTAAGGGAAAGVACAGAGLFGPAAAAAAQPGAPALCSVTGVDLSRGMLAQAARRAEALTVTQAPPAARPLALVAADGDATARDASAGARDSAVVPLRLVRADAGALPFADGAFDTALDTFSLCVLPDPQAALRELSRVTRPGGRVLLLEHSASDFAPLAAYQRATERVVAASSKGCAWAQDVVGMVERTPGLRVKSVMRHLPGGVLVSVEAERV